MDMDVLAGMTPADAECKFLSLASQEVALYGFDLYDAVDGVGCKISIGVNWEGELGIGRS